LAEEKVHFTGFKICGTGELAGFPEFEEFEEQETARSNIRNIFFSFIKTVLDEMIRIFKHLQN